MPQIYNLKILMSSVLQKIQTTSNPSILRLTRLFLITKTNRRFEYITGVKCFNHLSNTIVSQ